MTDYQILQITETDDIDVIKEAYRKLVKTIHPDVAAATFENHLQFIRVNQAYERLLHSIKAKKAATGGSLQKTAGLQHNDPILQQKDPAYGYYKAGMKEFMQIHPSQWTKETKDIMDKPGPVDLEAINQVQEKVKALVKRFPAAYYYFSIVVHEFPGSIWCYDSREKMKQIEDLTVRYEKIIASFPEHVKQVPRVNRMFYGKRQAD